MIGVTTSNTTNTSNPLESSNASLTNSPSVSHRRLHNYLVNYLIHAETLDRLPHKPDYAPWEEHLSEIFSHLLNETNFDWNQIIHQGYFRGTSLLFIVIRAGFLGCNAALSAYHPLLLKDNVDWSDIVSIGKFEGHTPLYWLLLKASISGLTAQSFLLTIGQKKGLNWNAAIRENEYYKGETPLIPLVLCCLHMKSQEGFDRLIEITLTHPIDWNARNIERNETALFLLLRFLNWELVGQVPHYKDYIKLIVEQKNLDWEAAVVSPDESLDGQTPLFALASAAAKGHVFAHTLFQALRDTPYYSKIQELYANLLSKKLLSYLRLGLIIIWRWRMIDLLKNRPTTQTYGIYIQQHLKYPTQKISPMLFKYAKNWPFCMSMVFAQKTKFLWIK